MFVQRTNGTITMMFAARQPGIAEEELADNHPDVVVFLNATKPQDQSSVDVQLKAVRTLALMIGQVGGLTVPQTKALFKQKWDLLNGS